MEWQSIDTASHLLRTRWRVLLYCPNRIGRKVVEGFHGFNGQFTGWFATDTGWHCEPTHWMALPEPPK